MGAKEVLCREVLIGLNQVLVVGPRRGPLKWGKTNQQHSPTRVPGSLVEMAQ